MFKLVFEKAEEPEIKLPTFSGSSKKQERNTDFTQAFEREEEKVQITHPTADIHEIPCCRLNNWEAESGED